MSSFKETFFSKDISTIKKELKTSSDFLKKLRTEDDWSFVIKSHSFLEAAVTELLTTKVGDERLKSVFRRLEMSNSETGKIVFLKSYELLTQEERRLIIKLSVLRNNLVHNIENLSFSFENYIQEMDKQQKESWASLFIRPKMNAKEKFETKKLALEKPKYALILGLSYLMLSIKYETISESEKLKRQMLSSWITAINKKIQ